MDREPVVRRAKTMSPAERQEAADMLATAFHHHPLGAAFFPHATTRRHALHAMFAMWLKDGVRFGEVDVAQDGKVVGVMISYLPGAYPMTLGRMLRVAPEFLRLVALSPMGATRMMRAKHHLEPHHPKEPHVYVIWLGAEIGQVGGRLINQCADRADAAGLPLYAETQERRMVRFLRAFGFAVLEDGVEVFPGGPRAWTHWRAPGREAMSNAAPASNGIRQCHPRSRE